MMFLRMVPFAFILTLGACAPVDPVGGGQIYTRCIVDGGSIQRPVCGKNQYNLCLVGTDAGNGESMGRCCNNDESAEVCAQRAGLAPTDAGRPPTSDR